MNRLAWLTIGLLTAYKQALNEYDLAIFKASSMNCQLKQTALSCFLSFHALFPRDQISQYTSYSKMT